MEKRITTIKKLFLGVMAFMMVYPAISQNLTSQSEKFRIMTTSTGLVVEQNLTDNNGKADQVILRITESGSGKLFWQGIPDTETDGSKIRYTVKGLNPDLWSPATPHLYNLYIPVKKQGQTTADTMIRVGFRDFETRNGQIFLNGHPLFLRGIAINPPGRGIPEEIETSRKFAEDYVSFMKSLHVNMIRIPDNDTWYDVCDELGMMVFGGNYSASVAGESPPKDYPRGVKWYQEEKYQPFTHHPSLMIYAMTNEVPYSGPKAQEWLDFLGHAHRELKKWDPTRLYIGNAGYGYGQSGDICDLHRYWGWYYSSPFTFLHIRDFDKITFPDKIQPLTFTECVGNYTGPDGRYNLTPNHKNPVSQLHWTGHAPQSEQAALADQHQSFVFRQVTELVRRLRRINPESSGVFPFTIMFRNWHTIENFADMGPKPVTEQAKLSYQPVLVSIENWKSQVYAGSLITPVAHIINDSEDFSKLTDVRLVVKILDKSRETRFSDTLKIPDIPYYDIHSEYLKINIPENLFQGEYVLEMQVLSKGKRVSQNYENLFVANQKQLPVSPGREIVLFDPSGLTSKALTFNGIRYNMISGWQDLSPSECLVIGENGAGEELATHSGEIMEFIRNGGRLVILRQDHTRQPFLKGLIPAEVEFPQMNIDDPEYPPPARPSRNGFNINPERPDHPVFDGITRERLRIWSDYTGWNENQNGFPAIYPVTDGFVLKNPGDLANTAVLANYSVGLEGMALAEFFEGKGSLLLSGFDLSGRSGIDPVSDRMLSNMIRYMSGSYNHQPHVTITSPVLWGEYETEKGLLTGIYSGFMLNSKPSLTGSYENLPILLEKDGHMYAGAKWGWNNRAGKHYVPYGRRIFGPYYHRDFGGVPTPLDPESSAGKAFFWCKVPEGTGKMITLVWNPANEALPLVIGVNDQIPEKVTVPPGAYLRVENRLNNSENTLKVNLEGDRRLVVLETSFSL